MLESVAWIWAPWGDYVKTPAMLVDIYSLLYLDYDNIQAITVILNYHIKSIYFWFFYKDELIIFNIHFRIKYTYAYLWQVC